MMDRSGVKSINTSVTYIQVAPTQPTSCFSFSQTQQSHLTRRHANSTSPLPTYSTRSRTMRQQEVTLMRRNIDTSFTGLPECIKVIALSLRRNSLRGRTAPPTPCSSPFCGVACPLCVTSSWHPFILTMLMDMDWLGIMKWSRI